QSIIPVFGSGWDPASFNVNTGEPSNFSISNEFWSWYMEEDIFYRKNSPVYRSFTDLNDKLILCRGNDCPDDVQNCITEGIFLPAGWFAYQEGAGPECVEESGNPNFGWGDGFEARELTFSLKVRDL